MQAILLAAGMGRRLKKHTADKTKCMVEVGGVTLIERALSLLDTKGLKRICIVCGYQKDKLKEFVAGLSVQTPVEFIDNDRYETTNNLYSLNLAADRMAEDDTLVLESDILFEDAVLTRLLAEDKPCVTFVAHPEPWMDGVLVTLDAQARIEEFVSAETFRADAYASYYKTVSMYRFSRDFIRSTYLPFLAAHVAAFSDEATYESVLKVVDFPGRPVIDTLLLTGERWYEINDIQDIDIAESIFAEGEERLRRYLSRYGGYWRYHGLYDFCYLVNPYFPNERFLNEMKSHFDVLIREYPSGQAVNATLAAKYFEVLPEQICVGNGSAELIKSLMEQMEGKMGMAYPTFEEYAHRRAPGDMIPFFVKEKDFKYTVDDLIAFYEEHPVKAIALVNPDNPTGHLILRDDILRLAAWMKERDMMLIVDESFIDFAKTGTPGQSYSDEHMSRTLLVPEILDEYPNIVVIKSISKSFGVAGLRLGVLASGNRKLIAWMKKDIAIWNINSFAEYYMQIIEKYKADYEEAMVRFKEVRVRYMQMLSRVANLKVYPSQANYIMARVTGVMSSHRLADVLLNKYNILIKDLSTKEGLDHEDFVRLSIKTDEENEALVKALCEILGEVSA